MQIKNTMTMTLDEAVCSIAVLIDDAERFKKQAAAIAQQIVPSTMSELSARFHSPSQPEPPGFGYEQRGLGGWLSIWQFAIFELLFQMGESALPMLRQIAFGPYDWTQGNAVEVLVRLAAKGVERAPIIADLRREFPRFRFEAQLYSVGPLLRHAKQDMSIAAVLSELEDMPAWQEAVEELTAS